MKRLLTFLYLLLGLVLLDKQAIARDEPATGTPFMNLPDAICRGSFASMNAFFWKETTTSKYADSATWVITGGAYQVLYGSDASNRTKMVGQKRDPTNITGTSNNYNINKNYLTVKFNDVAVYTVKVTLYRGGTPYVITRTMDVQNCDIQQCMGSGNNTGVPDFKEDFGYFNSTDVLGRSNTNVTGYDFKQNPYGAFGDDSYTIFHTTGIRNDWVKVNDHTGSKNGQVGGMLIANSSIEKRSFYTLDGVQVCPGSLYNFSAWFLNTNGYQVFNAASCAWGNEDGYHYAGVTFKIIDKKGSTNPANWVTLASFKTNDVSMNLAGPQWQRYGGTFKTPGGVNTVTLEIVNDRLGDCGNDIAIDDIAFSYCSPDIFSYIDGVSQPPLKKDSLCEGAPVTIKAEYAPNGYENGIYYPDKDYFKDPIYQWYWSNTGNETVPGDWFPLSDGNGITGTSTSVLNFADGALKGDPNQIVNKYYRVNIIERNNQSNCASPSAATMITILPKPKVTISSGRICIGQSVDLTASGGYSTYEWKVDPVFKGPKMTVYPDVSRDYWAVGIADYGWNSVTNQPRQCKDSGFAKIIVDQKPVTKITAAPMEICFGTPVNLHLDITNAPPDSLVWKWKYGADSIRGKVNDITHAPTGTGYLPYYAVVTNKTCVVTDSIKIQVRSLPVADVDTAYWQCNNPVFNIKRSTLPADQNGIWKFDGPSLGATIGNASTPATTISGVPAGDTVHLFWIITNGAMPACTDTNRVTLVNTKPLTVSVAGVPMTQCTLTSFQLGANAPAKGEKGKWTFGPGTTAADVSIDHDTAYNAIATIKNFVSPTAKKVTLVWTISNGVCTNSSSSIDLTVKDAPSVKILAPAVCNTIDSFNVYYSAVKGNITKYTLDAVSPAPMPGFLQLKDVKWPNNHVADSFRVKMPAGVPAGTYNFSLKVQEDTLHGCEVTVPFTIVVSTPSTPATSVTASVDQLCTSGDVTLKVNGGSLGTDSLGNKNNWKWYTGNCPGLPGSVPVTPFSSINNGAEVVFKGITTTTTFYVRAEGASKCAATACKDVTITVFTQPNTANANADQAECERATDFQLNGNSTGVPGLNGKWTSLNPRATITNPTQQNATVHVPVGDTATLVWTISNGPCISSSDMMFISNYKKPVVRDAGTNKAACDVTTFTMDATKPTELGAQGTWTFAPSTAAVTITDPNSAITSVTIPANSSVLFYWQISNPKCAATDYDTVRITSYNTPIVRDAGTNKAACDVTTFTMDATKPTELGAQGTWTFTPSTAAVSIADPNSPTTSVTIPANSTILFFWQISNPKCAATDYDTVRITSYNTPIVRDAGANQAACDVTTFTMNATKPTELGAQGNWTFAPSTAAVTITDPHSATTSVTIPANSSVLFYWQINNPKCAATDYDTVRITSYNTPIVRDAGTNKAACDVTTYTMDATKPTELGAQGTWTFAPSTAAVTITDPHSATTSVTIPANSTILFYWQISNPKCAATDYDTVRITNYNTPIVRDAGTNQAACDVTTFTMNATKPTELGAQGNWTFAPSTAAVTITDPHSATTSVTIPANSSVLFYWQISNPKCAATDYDTVRITSYNTPIVRDAGTNKAACDVTTYTMDATKPTELGAQGTWTFAPSTAAVTITDPHSATTSVTIPANSTILFYWQISNPKCAATDYDTVRITSYNTPIVRDAGANQAACDVTTFTMDATKPAELGAQGTWTFAPSTAAVTITDPHSATTSVTIPANSSVLFYWQISNPKCAATDYDTVRITSYKTPVVRDAGTNQAACDVTTFTMDATKPVELGAQGTWTFAPSTAAVTITDPHSATTSVTIPANSSILFYWQISNPKCAASDFDTVRITSYNTPVVRDAGINQAACDVTTFTMDATKPTELGAQGTWTFAPSTAAVTIVDPHSATTAVTIPANSSVLFYWQISNPKCAASDYDTVRITSYKKPVVRDAGTNQAACETTTFIMDATAPVELGAQGTWTFEPSAATVTIVDPHSATTSVTIPANSSILFYWKIANPKCDAGNYDTVRITSYLTPVVRDAGTNQAACDVTTFTMNATKPTELGAQGTWTFTPVGAAVTIVDPHSPTTSVTVPANSSILFFWQISNPKCAASDYDTVRITSYNTPVVRDAGSNQAACDVTTFTMNATKPGELGAQGTWTFAPSTAAVTITDPHSATTSVTIPANSSVLFYWQISNPKCAASDYDTVRITSYNTPIVRDAGTNKAACEVTTFTMDATKPTELGAQGTWTFEPSTAAVTIADPHSATTSVTIPANSTILFFWQISNPKCAASDFDTVRITSYKKPLVRDAGTNKAACDVTTFTMDATAPAELGAQGTWTFTPVGATVTVADPHSATTSVTIPADSTILFFWQISNPKCAADTYDTVRITSYKKPVVRDAGTNKAACEVTTFTMDATAPTELGAQGTWTFAPSGAAVTIVDPHSATTSVTIPANSTILFYWQISNPKCAASDFDTVRITSYKTPVVRDAGTNQAACDVTTFTMNATQPTELGAEGTWTFAPSGAAVTITDPHSATTSVTIPANSSILFYWKIANPKCAASDFDTVRITSYNTPVVRDAGTNKAACDVTTFTMDATAPTELGAQGTWTFEPSTAAVTIADPHSAATSVTIPANSSILFYWKIANPKCAAGNYDTVRITSYLTPEVRDAGSNQAACEVTTFKMKATAPTELGAQGTWTFAPSTAAVTIVDPHSATTSVTIPANSTILFYWQISNPKCAATDYDTVRITSYLKPAVRDAGTTKAACEVTTFTMDATAPTELGAQGTWTFAPSTAAVTITDPHSATTSVTIPANSKILFYWQISNPACAASDYDTVSITSYLKPVVRDAGSNQAACEVTTFTMDATVPTELGARGTWTFAPSTAAVTITDPHSATTSVTIPANSSVLFYWQISNPECAASNFDTVRITSYLKPEVRDAGTNQAACEVTTFTMNATSPNELGAQGTWTFAPSTAAVTIVDPHSATTSVTIPANSSVLFYWQISNPKCAANTYDTVRITSYLTPAVRDAGTNKAACEVTTFTMDATKPTELGAQGTWTFAPSTAAVTITDPHSATTSVTIPANSTILFYWQISNPKCAASDFDTVRITSYLKPAVRDAGSNKAACDVTTFTMDATKPTELGAQGTWTFMPSGAAVTITDPHSATTSVTVPANSSILFYWQISNPKCAADTYDTVRITSYLTPVVRDAGSNKSACEVTTFTMDATTPTELGAQGTWTFMPSGAAVTIADPHSATTSVTIPANSTILFYWQIKNPKCAASDFDTVRITSYLKPVVRDAGSNKAACEQTTFTMDATAPTELGAQGTWTFAPSTAAVTIANPHSATTSVTIPANSSVLFYWQINNPKCAADTYDTVRITSYLKPAVRDAGSNKVACEQTTFKMNATAPTELGAQGTWTFQPSTASVTIANAHDPLTSVTVPAESTILFYWQISNPKCAADTYDTVRITSYKTPAAAKAGPDQEKCDNSSFTLSGSQPVGLNVKGTWTNPFNVTGVTILSPNSYNSGVTVTAGVTVKLVWTITNGTCAASTDTVQLTNYAQANKANAGPDQAICNNKSDFIMDGNLPGVPTAKGTWTVIAGKAIIKSPNNPKTGVTVAIGDTATLQWAIANGVCDTTFSRVTIINYKAAVTADAGEDQEKCNTSLPFKMNASEPGSSSATGTWTDVSRVPGKAVIKDKNNPLTDVIVPIGDTVILKWTVANGTCTSTSSIVTLINYKAAAAANAGPDTAMCNNPGDFTMRADAPSVPSAKGIWTVIKGNATIKSINSPVSKVHVNVGDTVTLRWTIINGVCTSTSDDVVLINYRMPVASNAGVNQEHCDDESFKMKASDPGVPGAKGTWVVTSINAAKISISNINDKDATITVPAGETAQLTWVVSNGVCDASTSSVTLINRKSISGNTIKNDQTVCVTETPLSLSGNVLSGGNGTYTYQWQQSTTGAGGPFTNINGATSPVYQPGLLARNTWYRRLVTSGACINNISNVVKITVMTISPIVTFTPPAITTECVKGADYTTLFGTPVFSHAPYDDEKLSVIHNDVTVVTSPCLSTITRTWTATDRCGLSVTATQTITVKDTKAPVFTTPAPADITVDCDKVPAKTDLKAIDDCAGEVIIPVVEVRQDLPGNCSNNYLLIRTWTAKDECNTGVTLKQIITVKDMTAPVFNMATPADTTVDCDKIPAGFNLTATDNCTPGIITVASKDSTVHNPGNCNSNYLIYRKWTAFDECGNARAVQQIITVQDTTRPVFSMPAPKDTLVDCDKVPAWPVINATDNCSGNVQVFTGTKTVKLPGNCAANYQEIRTWTATDACGNKATMQQIITVQDTTKPVFTVKPPADTTVSCDNIPAPANDVQVSDNCSALGNGLTVTRRITTERTPGDCAGNYRIIRTWTAKDACGNTTTITQVVTVKDTTRPVIMPAPADIVLYCQDKIPTAPVLTATDNCDNSFPKRAIYTEDPYVADICNGYTIIRRWSITDACGNKANDVIQRVIIQPCDKPQLAATLPSNCSDNGRIALRRVGNVYLPTYTLVAVTPANAVTGLPRTQSNNVFNLNGATSASFIITDGRTGCSSDTVTYQMNYIQKPMVNLGNDTTICGGNNLVLDAGAANFAYQIQWSTGATTQRININKAGTYWVNVSNGECATTDTIHVGLVPTPLVDIPDTTICRGQTVKLDAYVNGAQYLWSTGSTEPSILVGTQEQFWVKVMKSGCITIDTVKVSVNPPPDISLSRDTSICPDQSIMLTVNSNGGRIKWQTGETSNSIVVNKPGGYWVAVSRDNCVVRDTVNVRMKPALVMDLGPDRNICPGGSITLDGTNPDAISYLWNDGDPNPIKTITEAGKYKLAVMDKYCQRVFMDSVKVNITGVPVINLGRDTTLCKGETLILRAEGGGISSVRWDNGSSGPTLTVTNGGTYTVTVFNDCGSATDDITVDFVQCEPKPTLPNAFSPNGDGRNDVFRPIVRGQMFDYELRIFNRWGELIFMTSDNHKGWDGKYKGVPVDIGTYVWWLNYKKVAGGTSNVLKGEVTVIR
ncbi:HYR-like domain-containing protein [Chitinophaga arvensicola]|uniref:Gliding motility-associated C-terminal domain-containing protein n=1 Tax=Chitinophaga arvensicola TaxID=29529 RepID=A0A1I0S5I7_9BACT|nr:gliding motility-associated C-terminal domain-containing protein [Chitinophaga arvensicola]SEW50425.1 gliding motility-associated C-terminal domain-containing protein [Chitinophaga arvensicola]